MSPHALYPLFNFGILAPWALLVFLPRWKWTQRLVHGAVVPVLLCIAYALLLVSVMTSKTVPPDAGGSSLEGVMKMFQVPALALVCWIHYLVFDLFVGAWILRDGQRRRVSHLAIAPCLVLTLFFGPIGLSVYLVARYVKTRTLSLVEDAGAPA